jgi:hypothetical protein
VQDLEPSVQRPDAVLEIDEVVGGVAVALNLDHELPVTPGGADRDHAAAAVPDDLCDDEVGRRLNDRRQPPLGQRRDPDRDRGIFCERLHGGREALVGKHRREDPMRELAKLPQGDAQFVFRLVDAGAAAGVGGGLELGAGKPQREREADQPLLGAVVQVAL